MFNSELRLMPMISIENEWKYLVNETFIGEKCIVPLLNQVLTSDIIPASGFKYEIERQLSEEINHVRIYYKYVGADKLEGSQYDQQLFDVISTICSPTLKLFALQGMLEGIALGALDYRLKFWNSSPSAQSDFQVKKDEEGHTTLSYPFLKDLVKYEGAIGEEKFREVSKKVNEVFINSFSGQILKNYVHLCESETHWSPSDFEKTNAIQEFKRQSAKTISKNRKSFLKCYSEALVNV